MTVTVSESGGSHRAVVIHDGTGKFCCDTGHPDPVEAAGHAWRLTRALARREERSASMNA